MENKNIEHETLLDCTSALNTHFAAADLLSLRAGLVQERLIPRSVNSELDKYGPDEKASKITEAVQRTIKAESTKFSSLIELLKTDMSVLAKILQEKRGMLCLLVFQGKVNLVFSLA